MTTDKTLLKKTTNRQSGGHVGRFALTTIPSMRRHRAKASLKSARDALKSARESAAGTSLAAVARTH